MSDSMQVLSHLPSEALTVHNHYFFAIFGTLPSPSHFLIHLNPEYRGSTFFETSEHSNQPEFDNLRVSRLESPKTSADSATSEIRENRASSPLQPPGGASGGRGIHG
jgi:hypothetical protein